MAKFESDPTVSYSTQTKTLLYLGGLGAALMASGFSFTEKPDFVLIIGGAILLSIGFISNLHGKQRLVINKEGIHDKTLWIGLIPWSDILEARLLSQTIRYRGGTKVIEYIGLTLRDPSKYLQKLSRLTQRLIKLNKYFLKDGQEFNVYLEGFGIDGEVVLKQIQERLKR